MAQDKTDVQRQIDATNRQIDRLVYDLYELADVEIAIVEGDARLTPEGSWVVAAGGARPPQALDFGVGRCQGQAGKRNPWRASPSMTISLAPAGAKDA